jgi:hypothetical protein
MNAINGSIFFMHDFNADHRPLRPREGSTASSHPELLEGDLAIAPRRPVSITAMNQSITSDGSRQTFGVAGVTAVVALLAIVGVATRPSPVDAEAQMIARNCLKWHRVAADAVSQLAQSTRDADLLQVGDSVFRMRRARRNCEAGWVTLACQDYHAVASGLPGIGLNRQMFECARFAESPAHQN